MGKYEDMTKGLMQAVAVAREAAEASTTIKDKARFHRLQAALQGALSIVRKNHYEYEDALAVPVNRCGECGRVTL